MTVEQALLKWLDGKGETSVYEIDGDYVVAASVKKLGRDELHRRVAENAAKRAKAT